MTRWIRTALATIAGAAVCAGAAEQGPDRPVALVVEMADGAIATCTTSDGRKRTIERLDWLPDKSRVEAGSADLLVVFEPGVRYRFGRGARFTVSARGPEETAGPVEELERIPSLPLLTLAKEARPGPRAGGLRIRGGLQGLYPDEPARALCNGTFLSFVPAPGATSYQVVVRDGQGQVLWQAVTESPALAVPQGILRPAAPHSWTVTTQGLVPELMGTARFATLSESEAGERERLRAKLGASASDRALLGAVDLRLGLLESAREHLEAARAQEPSSAVSRWLEAIDRLQGFSGPDPK